MIFHSQSLCERKPLGYIFFLSLEHLSLKVAFKLPRQIDIKCAQLYIWSIYTGRLHWYFTSKFEKWVHYLSSNNCTSLINAIGPCWKSKKDRGAIFPQQATLRDLSQHCLGKNTRLQTGDTCKISKISRAQFWLEADMADTRVTSEAKPNRWEREAGGKEGTFYVKASSFKNTTQTIFKRNRARSVTTVLGSILNTFCLGI